MSGASPSRSLALRATIALPIALLAFVVLHGALGVGRDTTPRIHSLRNPLACAECHSPADSATLTTAEPALCRRCHGELPPECELPAASEQPACTTCHDPHGKENRLPGPVRRGS